MPRIITIYLETADGKTDEPTGIHVDHGDGSATWATSASLDSFTPAGSPKSLRAVLRRLRDDVAPMPKSAVKASAKAPPPSALDPATP